MAQRPTGTTLTSEALVKYMRDISSSVADLQTSVDSLSKKMDENTNALTARVSTIGNQVSYFRQTVCDHLKSMVSSRVKKREIN